MKYFVAHLLEGEVAEYHRELTLELSRSFNTYPIHEKVSPHITVKIPFEANGYEIARVEDTLERFAEAHAPEPMIMEGFGRFGFKTIYLDVVKSRAAANVVRECVEELNALEWMQRVRHEGNKLHVSVARFLTYTQFKRVWRNLKHERPRFKHTLDSLVILRKEAGARTWSVHREFSLTAPAMSREAIPVSSSVRCTMTAHTT